MCEEWTQVEINALSELVQTMSTSSTNEEQEENCAALQLDPTEVVSATAIEQHGVLGTHSQSDGEEEKHRESATHTLVGDSSEQQEVTALHSPSSDSAEQGASTSHSPSSGSAEQGVSASHSPSSDSADQQVVPTAHSPGNDPTNTPIPVQKGNARLPPSSPVGTQTTESACLACNGLSGVGLCGVCLLETINDNKVHQDRRITVLVQAQAQEITGLKVEIARLSAELKLIRSRCDSHDGKYTEVLKRTKPKNQKADDAKKSAATSLASSAEGGQQADCEVSPSPTSTNSPLQAGSGLLVESPPCQQQQSDSPEVTSPANVDQPPEGSRVTPPLPQASHHQQGDMRASGSTSPAGLRPQKGAASNPSPRLPLLRPLPNTKHVVLGDSNLKKVDRKRFDPSGTTYIKSVGGLTISQATEIIEGTQQYSSIETVTVHVGTNDLANGHSDDEIIDNINLMISKLRAVFPNASVFISGILPQKGTLLGRIVKLNGKLLDICHENAATLISDRKQFLAKDNFPSHLFTKDKLHLNEKGLGVLLRGFKYALREVQKRGEVRDLSLPKEQDADVGESDFPSLSASYPRGHRSTDRPVMRQQRHTGAGPGPRSRQTAPSRLVGHSPSPSAPNAPHIAEQSPTNVSASEPERSRVTDTDRTTEAMAATSAAPQQFATPGHPFNSFSRHPFISPPTRNAYPFQPFSFFQWPFNHGPFPSHFMPPHPYSFHGPHFVGR